MTVLLISLGAAVGAPLRYLVDRALTRTASPWGTLVVNVGGSGLLGVVVANAPDAEQFALLATGFCGALTTYSTFSYETLRLIEQGRGRRAMLFASVNLGLGFGALALGVALAGWSR